MIVSNYRPTRRELLRAGVAGYAALTLPSSLLAKIAQAPSKEWLKKAQEVYGWLYTMRIKYDDGRIGYRIAEGIGRAETNLYGGTAGVLLFLQALDEAAPTKRLKADRQGAVKYLADALDRSDAGLAHGLYSGASGVEDILAREWQDGNATDMLPSHASAPFVAGEYNDMTVGLAGMCVVQAGQTSLFASSIAGARSGSALADELVLRAEKTDKGCRWPATEGGPSSVKNDICGTVGAAYALACAAHLWPERKEYLEAALQGVAYLDSQKISFSSCQIDPLALYTGRGNGPIELARLFVKLDQVQPKSGWMARAEACAKQLMQSDCDKRKAGGSRGRYSDCNGNAGVAMFFADLHRQTKKKMYLEYSIAHVREIDAKATIDEKGRRWAWSGVSPQTGLMQGAAGIGLMYLSLHALEHGKEWTHRLPDDPWYEGLGE